MPDKSQNQTVAMNMAKAIQAGKISPKPGTASADIASSMKPKDLADFGGPVNKGLPRKVAPAPAPAPTPAPRAGMKMTNTPTGTFKAVPGSKFSLGGKK